MRLLYFILILGSGLWHQMAGAQNALSVPIKVTEKVNVAWDITLLDDGYLLTGSSSFLINGYVPFTVSAAKTDFEGNLLWSRAYFQDVFPTLQRFSAAYSNVIHLDSSFFLFYGAADSTYLGKYIWPQFGVLRLDENGKMLDDFRYPRADSLQWDMPREIYLTPDTNLMLYGQRILNPDTSDLLLRKINPKGELLWERIIGYPGIREDPWNVTFSPDGDILLGTSCFVDTTFTNHDTSHYILRRYTPQGDLIWQKAYYPFATGYAPRFCFVQPRPGGYYMTAGRPIPFNDPDYGKKSAMLFIGLSEEGLIEWEIAEKDLDDLETDFKGVFSTKNLRNGDFFIIGKADKDNHEYGWAMRLGPGGEKRWSRMISDPRICGEDHDGWLYSAEEASNGDLIFSGDIRDTSQVDPAQIKYWLVRLDSMGCSVPGCTDDLVVFSDTLTSIIYPVVRGELRAWPVPCPSGHPLQVQVAVEGGTIELSDLFGRVVATQTSVLTTSPIEISTANLIPGVYTLSYRYNRGQSVDAIQVVVQ